MAGDWIKMRGNLWDDPRISKIVEATDTNEATVIGGLYWLWATADQHSEDGILLGLTPKSIDRKTGINGFGVALISIGWLADHPEGVRITHFEEHNGTSAKSRLMTAKRVAEHKSNAKVTVAPLPEQAQTVTEPLPREREREEKEIKETKSKSKAETQAASRLPADWSPSVEDIEFCKTTRQDLEPQAVAVGFVDYWIAQPGTKGRKADWPATWRNWVRNQRTTQQARASPPQYENARDKSRRETIEALTGKRHEQCDEHRTIDI